VEGYPRGYFSEPAVYTWFHYLIFTGVENLGQTSWSITGSCNISTKALVCREALPLADDMVMNRLCVVSDCKLVALDIKEALWVATR
jgi:hypothetical protein